ncbi:MAG: SDR family oxidoreductase [Candidatus Bathyarchaeota archaeon]|jgi:3-oxoacyl-[acyl-carrier protein] reductase
MSFEDKTALITGASGGIGSETARLFAKEGANIVVNYLSSQGKAEETLREVGEIGSEAFNFRADVSDPEQVRSMMEAAFERFGGIDVLVNCAAQHPPPMFDLDNPDWELWKRMAHVNIMGILICSHHAAPYLREGVGNIVNVVMDWDPGGLGYSLTKTTGTPLTRGLARKMAPIRVNAVSPGAVDTWGMTDEEIEYYTGVTLLKRVGHPRDIAQVILFLASEGASYITGETIQVDGGTRLLV